MRFIRNVYQIFSDWVVINLIPMLIILFLFIGGVVILYPRIVILVPAGSVGVMYRALDGGVALDEVVPEGVTLILPWNSVSQYNSRIQVQSLELDVLTSDLLKSKVKLNFQFEVNRLTVPLLHKFVGPNYVKTMVIPEVTSVTREMFGRLSSTQAFTEGINQVVRDIAITADRVIIDKLSPPGLTEVRLVRISAVQLESITFPSEIQKAIEDKLTQAQVSESYIYKLQTAEKEAQRKVLEAKGIKDFQDIVNAGMTENYLRYRGIEASENLAKSENSKIIMFGTSTGGLPLILGGTSSEAGSLIRK